MCLGKYHKLHWRHLYYTLSQDCWPNALESETKVYSLKPIYYSSRYIKLTMCTNWQMITYIIE